MENNIPIESHSHPLAFADGVLETLREISRWAYFLAIIGFIGVGFMVLIGLFLGSFIGSILPSYQSVSSGFVSLVYIILALIYFFPVLYLYRFSVNLKSALRENRMEVLAVAFQNMRSLFRFMGIVTIVILSLYLIFFVSALLFGIFSRG